MLDKKELLNNTIEKLKVHILHIQLTENIKDIVQYLERKNLANGICSYMGPIANIHEINLSKLFKRYYHNHGYGYTFYLGSSDIEGFYTQDVTKEGIIKRIQLRIDVLSEILVNKEYEK